MEQLSSTAVESAWLLDRLEECRARRQVLILDCCFSGAFAQTKGSPEVDLERRLVGAGRGRAVLTASRSGEYSHEGAPLPGTGTTRSVFTAALVDGLREGDADRDGDGYISVEDAYAYAADQVKAAGSAQNPQRWLYGGEGEIVLARNPRGMALTVNQGRKPRPVLTVSREIYDGIVEHARRDYPRMACGMVAAAAGSQRAPRLIPISNRTGRSDQWEFDPFEQINAWRQMDERGEEPIIVYHSRPDSDAYLSRVDIDFGNSNNVDHFVIVAVDARGMVDFRSYQLTDTRVFEEDVRLIPGHRT